jgi:hypothetical protein
MATFYSRTIVCALAAVSSCDAQVATANQPWYYHRVVTPILKVYDGLRWYDWTSKFQLYVLASTSAEGTGDDTTATFQADLFAAQLSNWVCPSVSYAYFKAKAEYAGSWDDAKHDFTVGASTSAMGTIFTRMIQFEDTDGDGQFTAEIDQVVDEYKFAAKNSNLPWPYPTQKWDSGEKDTAGKWAKIKTKGGHFMLTMKANENTWTTEGGTALTPMNVKVDIEIDYPNLKAGNLVALETFVVSTQAQANAAVSATNSINVPQPESATHQMLKFAWDGEASLDGDVKNGVTVKASAMSSASLDDILDNHTVKSLGVSTSADGTASLNVQRVMFAFNTPKAGKILWDPSVGLAEPDAELVNSAHCSRGWIFALVIVLMPSVVVVGSVSLRM